MYIYIYTYTHRILFFHAFCLVIPFLTYCQCEVCKLFIIFGFRRHSCSFCMLTNFPAGCFYCLGAYIFGNNGLQTSARGKLDQCHSDTFQRISPALWADNCLLEKCCIRLWRIFLGF